MWWSRKSFGWSSIGMMNPLPDSTSLCSIVALSRRSSTSSHSSTDNRSSTAACCRNVRIGGLVRSMISVCRYSATLSSANTSCSMSIVGSGCLPSASTPSWMPAGQRSVSRTNSSMVVGARSGNARVTTSNASPSVNASESCPSSSRPTSRRRLASCSWGIERPARAIVDPGRTMPSNCWSVSIDSALERRCTSSMMRRYDWSPVSRQRPSAASAWRFSPGSSRASDSSTGDMS